MERKKRNNKEIRECVRYYKFIKKQKKKRKYPTRHLQIGRLEHGNTYEERYESGQLNLQRHKRNKLSNRVHGSFVKKKKKNHLVILRCRNSSLNLETNRTYIRSFDSPCNDDDQLSFVLNILEK